MTAQISLVTDRRTQTNRKQKDIAIT